MGQRIYPQVFDITGDVNLNFGVHQNGAIFTNARSGDVATVLVPDKNLEVAYDGFTFTVLCFQASANNMTIAIDPVPSDGDPGAWINYAKAGGASDTTATSIEVSGIGSRMTATWSHTLSQWLVIVEGTIV